MDRIFFQFLDEAWNVARIGNEDIARAKLHADHRVHGERENMIERQGANEIERLGLALVAESHVHPQVHLLDIGQNIAVGQHRALGYAGRAAGILQEGDVATLYRHRIEGFRAALRQRILEAHMAGNIPGRDHLFHAAHDQIDDVALETEHIAHGSDEDIGHIDRWQCLFNRGGEVFQHDERLCAGIVQLVFKFARRIERIDVHDHETGPQNCGKGNRILKDVRHHDGDAVALDQPA